MCKVVAEWPQKLIKIAKRTLQVKRIHINTLLVLFTQKLL